MKLYKLGTDIIKHLPMWCKRIIYKECLVLANGRLFVDNEILVGPGGNIGIGENGMFILGDYGWVTIVTRDENWVKADKNDPVKN